MNKQVKVLDNLISELTVIRNKYYNNESVGNDDWVKVAIIMRENMLLFMYNPEQI